MAPFDLEIEPVLLSQDSWDGGDSAEIALVALPAEVLAERLGVELQHDHEEGMGPVYGFGLKIGGRLYALYSYEHAVQDLDRRESMIVVDARDLATFGVDEMLAMALRALELEDDDLVWKRSDSA